MSVWSLAMAATTDPKSFPSVTCANLSEELLRLKSMSGSVNNSVVGYTYQATARMESFFSDYVQLEGATQTIPKGYFSPLKRAFDDMAEVQPLIEANSKILDARFDELIQVLPSCLKSN
jgi:hypothetical protein